jgi:thioredoxin 1
LQKNGLRKGKPVFRQSIVVCLILMLTIITTTCSIDAEKQIINNTNTTNTNLAPEFPPAPIELDDKNLDFMLKIYSPFVVDCWELGCKPCELIDPTINEMAIDLKGRVIFGKLCIDQNVISANKYEISRTPTLLIFRNGTLIFKHVGNYPKQKLEEIILTVLRMR